jgi:hypothetical protein
MFLTKRHYLIISKDHRPQILAAQRTFSLTVATRDIASPIRSARPTRPVRKPRSKGPPKWLRSEFCDSGNMHCCHCCHGCPWVCACVGARVVLVSCSRESYAFLVGVCWILLPVPTLFDLVEDRPAGRNPCRPHQCRIRTQRGRLASAPSGEHACNPPDKKSKRRSRRQLHTFLNAWKRRMWI